MGIDYIRNMFPAGCRVQLMSMRDDPQPIEPGSKGTVSGVDDIGTVHVNWDNGSCLGLVFGVDRFYKI